MDVLRSTSDVVIVRQRQQVFPLRRKTSLDGDGFAQRAAAVENRRTRIGYEPQRLTRNKAKPEPGWPG